MNTILKKIFVAGIRFLLWIQGLTRKGQKTLHPQSIVVFGYMGLGNAILLSPMMRILKKTYPHAQITFITSGRTGTEEIISEQNLAGEIVIYDYTKRKFYEKLQFSLKLLKKRYDMVLVNFHHIPFTLYPALLNIPVRVGHVSSTGWKSIGDSLFNIRVRMKDGDHEVIRDIDLIGALGVDIMETDRIPFFAIAESHEQFANKFIAAQNIHNDDLIIGMQWGTSPEMRWKQWPLDHWKKLCECFIEKYSAKVLIFGSKNESTMINEVIQQMNHKPVNAAGKTSIGEVAALLKKCKFVICNDSGLMHLSAAVSTPVVVLHGPTDLSRTKPCSQNHLIVSLNLKCSPCFCLEGDKNVTSCFHHKCLNGMSVYYVYKKIVSYFNMI